MVADDRCVLYRDVPAIAHPLSLLSLFPLTLIVTLQSSLLRTSVPRSSSRKPSTRSSTTFKGSRVVVRLYGVVPQCSFLVSLLRVFSCRSTAVAQAASFSPQFSLPNTFRFIVTQYEKQVRLHSLCRILSAGAHPLNLPRSVPSSSIRCSSITAPAAIRLSFVNPESLSLTSRVRSI